MKDNNARKHLVYWLGILTCLLTLSQTSRAEPLDPDLFGEPAHKLVYQLNKADPDYIEHILAE